MAGRIRRDDIEELRSRIRIDDVVSGYVALRPAGADSLKGLCPFHDEKTPSFHVRPSYGRWHCFGCDEGGDAISFVEKIEHLSFVEAVEFLARKAGMTLRYEESDEPRNTGGPRRGRLIDAHRVAVEFYSEQLTSPEGEKALASLRARGFTDADFARYNIGYSPATWQSLTNHLRSRGFSDAEIQAAGLATRGNNGLYDRFRGRLMWPIFSISGEPIGFGARKLSDEEEGPKYLNTPETPIYKKSQVLYGLNLAKKAIASEKKIVIVEGYTDVMAAQLAGVECAVATCGTAFGAEHVKVVRRLLGDGANPAAGVTFSNGKVYGGEVIFTFDGDAAGQKAAMRAFEEDQSFAAQTFVAVAEDGMDPCEVRMKYGDEGVRYIINSRVPLFEFVIKSVLAQLPLNTAEGRTAALRATAPIVASIRDRVLRGEYVRQLADWLGMGEEVVRRTVAQAPTQKLRGQQSREYATATGRDMPNQAGRSAHPGEGVQSGGGTQSGGLAATGGNPHEAGKNESEEVPVSMERLIPREQLLDPVARTEREVLAVLLQLPWYARTGMIDQFPPQTFTYPLHRKVFEAVVAAGGLESYQRHLNELVAHGLDAEKAQFEAASLFVTDVCEQADEETRRAISQVAVETLPENRTDRLHRYAWSVSIALRSLGIQRQIAELRSELQRTSDADPQKNVLFQRLMELEILKRRWEAQLEQ